jgi:hypothetical protein
VDETGHSGDTGAAESGSGADSHDRTLLNGWATADSPWSNPGSALDPEDDVPAWRRTPSEGTRPYGQRQFPPTAPDLPPGHPSGETRPPGPLPSWSDGRARYSDLLANLSPNEPYLRRPDSLQSQDEQRAAGPAPASAPPYPYEGDLDDGSPQVPLERPRAAFPAARPAPAGGRRPDWATSESARHAVEPIPEPIPEPAQRERLPTGEDNRAVNDQANARPSYDPSTFPRRLPYEPVLPPTSPAPHAESTPLYATPTAAYNGYSGRPAGDPGAALDEHTSMGLPQRVPAEPDVPTVPEPPPVEPTAETPALARIATHLRRGDLLPAQERQEGFDVQAILGAVREVEGVRGASLRTTPTGAHSLRLDLSDGADPAEVSRQVARLLQDRMGLDAAMQGSLGPAPVAAAPVQAAPVVPPPVVPLSPVVPPQPPGFTQQPAYSPPSYLPTRQPSVPAQPTVPTSPAPVLPTRSATAPPRVAPTSPPPAAAQTSAPSIIPARPAHPLSTATASTSFSSSFGEGTPAADFSPPRPLEVNERPGPRVLIESVQVNTFGTEANVEVRLAVGDRTTTGLATGPAVDGYLLRLCAMATGQAIDELMSASDHVDGPAKCFVEHAASVPFGALQVAVVVLLLSCGGWVEQLAGSAVITGDDRHAMVRATLAAVNRRLEALLS